MRTAIIGAGLSGLACALTLEKEGLAFDLFEQRPLTGELVQHAGAMLEIMNRPIKDQLAHLRTEFGLDIKPINTLNRIVMNTPHKQSTIEGNIGYLFRRGQKEDSIEQQLTNQLRTPIQYTTYADWRKLQQEYDHVVICDGQGVATRELGCWVGDSFRAWVMGANILGEFDPNTLVMFLNTNYCKSGYAYLVPMDETHAFLGLVVPNCDRQELDYYWDIFLRMENIQNEITELFKVHHRSGHVFPHQVNNIKLAGLAGGFIDPFLGFGQFTSLSTGAMAALSIARGLDYEAEVATITKEIRYYTRYREFLDRLNNSQLDKLVKLLGFPVVNPLVYNSNLPVMRYGGVVLDTYRKIKDKMK